MATKDYLTAGVQPAQPAAPLSAQTSSVAARLAAADSRDRLLGQGAPLGNTGNILTNPTLRPVTAESNALQAKITARSQPGGITIQPAGVVTDSFASPLGTATRRIAPTVANANPVIAGAAPVEAAADGTPAEVPWWQRSSFDPKFQSYIDQSKNETMARDEAMGLNVKPSEYFKTRY